MHSVWRRAGAAANARFRASFHAAALAKARSVGGRVGLGFGIGLGVAFLAQDSTNRLYSGIALSEASPHIIPNASSSSQPGPASQDAVQPNVIEDPFRYESLRKGLEERKKREKQLMDLRAKARNRVFLLQQRFQRGDINAQGFDLEMHKLKEALNREAQQLLFGVSAELADAREDYLVRFGCVKWSQEAMSAIAALAPLVEIGAGNGQWTRELAGRWKADIVAYDDHSQLPLDPAVTKEHGTQVQQGDETVLKSHSDRTLLLVCPPPSDMAVRCLAHFKGNRLVFVGEGRDGAHADAAFFDKLEREWVVSRVIDVEPFPECFERCFILERRPSKGWWAWLMGR